MNELLDIDGQDMFSQFCKGKELSIIYIIYRQKRLSIFRESWGRNVMHKKLSTYPGKSGRAYSQYWVVYLRSSEDSKCLMGIFAGVSMDRRAEYTWMEDPSLSASQKWRLNSSPSATFTLCISEIQLFLNKLHLPESCLIPLPTLE